MDLAAQYSAIGQKAAAGLLVKYVKRHEYDISTRSPLPTVVPISDGDTLSYRIDPNVQALDNPSNRYSKPSRRLNMVSVPVLIALVCETNHLNKYRNIRVNTSASWFPSDKRHWAKVPWDAVRYGHLRGSREKITERVVEAKKLDLAFERLN
jgi:hypothetical protein